MVITSCYAAILSLVYIALSMRVIALRRSGKVSLGSGGKPFLERAIRAHANFAEYAPLAILLIALAEGQGAWPWTIHILGATLLLGRTLHAYGISRPVEDFRFRVSGMAMTCILLDSTWICSHGNSMFLK